MLRSTLSGSQRLGTQPRSYKLSKLPGSPSSVTSSSTSSALLSVDAEYQWFGRALLEGAVIPSLKPLRACLASKPSLCTQPYTQRKVSAIVDALRAARVCNRAGLLARWRLEPIFLRDAFLLWLADDLAAKLSTEVPSWVASCEILTGRQTAAGSSTDNDMMSVAEKAAQDIASRHGKRMGRIDQREDDSTDDGALVVSSQPSLFVGIGFTTGMATMRRWGLVIPTP